MAKDHHPHHISQAIQEMLKSQHLKPKFDEANVIVSWEKIVGKSVAKQTKRVSIRNKVLFVELLSPSFKHELTYHKAHLIELLEKEFGKGVVGEIILM